MSKKTELSFEFFPPKTDRGADNLVKVREELAALNPNFFSVTFGAGGSTQEGTFEAVKSILESGRQAAPHISCVGGSEQSIRELIESYLQIGVKRVVALRGDLPSGMVDRGDFHYANDLVAFIRKNFGDALHIEVAAYPEFHPESRSPSTDIENFKRKVDAGANSALTQYFFNADSYFSYVDQAQAAGVDVPIVPGIMPITNYAQLARFSDMCGAEIPRWLRLRLEQYQDDADALLDYGLDVVSKLSETLLENGAPGIHFYALNKTSPTLDICQRLGLTGS